MSVEYRTVVSLKAQLSKFSGIIPKSFKQPKKRLIREMLYGIQASKDVKLSNLTESTICFIQIKQHYGELNQIALMTFSSVLTSGKKLKKLQRKRDL